MNNILWVDDEIDLLLPHILFLRRKEYSVTTATNGSDAVALIKKSHFDLVILDEMMIGMDGLTTLKEIKKIDPNIKAVMLTKSEEENIFLEAVGSMINDYLTKPVSPMQLYLTCKKNLEQDNLIKSRQSRNYLEDYSKINALLSSNPDANEWLNLGERIFKASLLLDEIGDENLSSTLNYLKNSADQAFGSFIEKNYPAWVNSLERPDLSVDIAQKYIIPALQNNEKVLFVLIDCLRYDQMLVLNELLQSDYDAKIHNYYSLLPTSTIFARNALFSGQFPDQIAEKYPNLFVDNNEDEQSCNRFEPDMLIELCKQNGLDIQKQSHYHKIYQLDEALKLEAGINELTGNRLISLVVDFIDFLLHDKNKASLISEMIVTEKAYRSTVRSWFENSSLKNIITKLADQGYKVVITTDHGARKVNKFNKVHSDGAATPGLRYKLGKNMSVGNKKQCWFVQQPTKLRLPQNYRNRNLVLAKEDQCLVFESNLHDFHQHVKNSYQHGGISIDEMILSVLTLVKK